MSRKTKPTPTDLELEIMKVVWDLQSGTVREVYEVLLAERAIAYTTVMTVMKILEDKGRLRRHRQGRAFVYHPTAPRQRVLAGMVDDLVTRAFDGSARSLVLSLVNDRKLSREDLAEISRLIESQEDAP